MLKTSAKTMGILKTKTTTVAVQSQRASNIRRQRGYIWEDTVVKRFNGVKHWKAFRLGSPSISLPDVLALNTRRSTLYTIEAKSGTGTSLSVPFDQIERCLEWTRVFGAYKKRRVLLAFKFLSKKRIGRATYESRQLREFFKVWDESRDVTDCVCTYDGRFFARINGGRIEIPLEEAEMPFKTKQGRGI